MCWSASSIEIEWLADLYPAEVIQRIELTWNDQGRRVDECRKTLYGQITLEETISPAAPSERASEILASVVLAHQLAEFRDLDAFYTLQARLALIAQHFPEEKFPSLDEEGIRDMVGILCREKTRMEEVTKISLAGFLAGRLTGRQRSLLDRETPERARLKAGRAVKIHYERAAPPWIESRLQDFFGMSSAPSICRAQVPLTVHLLAPNGRAVQVTSDLAGFWQRHYPSIRKELQRRYPKHSWPEL
jgi:ATP-dependent helicase HrpB